MIDKFEVEELLAEAVAQVARLNEGEEFMTRDLFRGYEWRRIKGGARTLLGKAFYQWVGSEGVGRIIPLDKTAQNQQLYRRV